MEMTISEALLRPDHTMVRWREPLPAVTHDGKKWTCCEYHSMTVADALRRQWYEFPSSRVEQPYADALRMFLERKNGELMSAPGWARPEASLSSPPAKDYTQTQCPGMTLRQWYAGMALAGCLSGGGDEVLIGDDCKDIERAFRNHQADVAKACFSYADAMIAESERTPHAQATRTA